MIIFILKNILQHYKYINLIYEEHDVFVALLGSYDYRYAETVAFGAPLSPNTLLGIQ